jgi:TolB-like protein/Tfp pilus assembly protein PilF
MLKRELDSEPEPATRALIQEIRSGTGASLYPPPVRPERTASHNAETSPPEPPVAESALVPTPHRWRMSTVQRGISFGIAGILLLTGILALMPALTPTAVGDRRELPTPSIENSAPWTSPPLSSRPVAASSTGRTRGIVAIAVLPFTSHAEENTTPNLLAEIITDDLTNTLSRIAVFRVISRQTSATYRNRHIDAAAIGAELGVAYILEGSVSVHGNALRVNAALVDAKTQLTVWSGRFDRASDQRHRIQDEIVNGLGRELQIEIAGIESGLGSQDPSVHELIFKGWVAMAAAGRSGMPALQEAEAYFTRALALEPDNPRALIGIGSYHVNMAIQLFTPDAASHLSKAEGILKDVIARRPNMAMAYQIMGALSYARGNSVAAASWFERAIEINPSQAPSYAHLGRALVANGSAQQGLEHILYAMRLSPRDPNMAYWLGYAGFAELERKRYPNAIQYLEKAMALNPDQPRSLLTLVAAHALAGNTIAAQQRLEQLQQKQPHLSTEKLSKMYFGKAAESRPPQMSEGLRLVLARQTPAAP